MGEHSLETPRQLFERLQARLETEQARLQQWQAVEDEYQRKYTEGLVPLETQLQELRMKLVLCLITRTRTWACPRPNANSCRN